MARSAPALLRWPDSLVGGWPVWFLTSLGLLTAAELASLSGAHDLALVWASASIGSLSFLALASLLAFVRACLTLARGSRP